MQTEFPLGQALIDAAESWPVYRSTMTSMATSRYGPITRDCDRCVDCDVALYPRDDTNARIRHLVECHNYRMDGRIRGAD